MLSTIFGNPSLQSFMKVNTARSTNLAKLSKFANMKLNFHNIGFSPGGKPIFPNATSKKKKTSDIQQQRLAPKEVRPHQPNRVVFDRLVVVQRFVQGILLAT